MEKSANYRLKRTIIFLLTLAGVGVWLIVNPASYESAPAAETPAAETPASASGESQSTVASENSALTILAKLEIKGRAPKTGYKRTEFYDGWPNINGCSLRQIIIKREAGDSAELSGCDVIKGKFTEPYTGKIFEAFAKSDFSKHIQIDHVVALSDAWQKGAQYKTKEERFQLATDPLNLLAVDSSANQQKSDGDAATWLPPNKSFRCQYVARQTSVKYKYGLWVTQAEHDAIAKVLETCPSEPAVGI
ncbi:HNH endonuclease [Candidatus Saccharibacteria bacterium]|nr:HNH endonuclease [Candidatus Saccharibacteria bacterium]